MSTRFLAVFLCLSLTSLSQATAQTIEAKDSNVVKFPDARNAYCAHVSDLAVAGYRPLWASVTVSEDQKKISANVSMAAVVCRLKKDGYQFEARSFTEPVQLEDLNGPFWMKFKNVRGEIFNSGHRLIAIAPASDRSLHVFNFVASLEDFVTPAGLEKLEAAGSVRVKTKFHLAARTASHGNTQYFDGAGGAYELSFLVTKNMETGSLQIQQTLLK